MIVITSSTVLFCQLLFALWVYGKLYSLVNITWMWFYVAQRKNNIAREWPVQKLAYSFGGIPQFLSECTALGRCFFWFGNWQHVASCKFDAAGKNWSK